MRFRLRRALAGIPVMLALLWSGPSGADEVDLGTFPFETEAGAYRNLVAEAGSLRMVFAAVTVERLDQDTALLHIGGERRVIVQSASDLGFRTVAALYAEDAPILLKREEDRIALEGALRAVVLPISDQPGIDPGVIEMQGMRAVLTMPAPNASTVQEATFDAKADAMRIDKRLLGLPAGVPSTLETGAGWLEGRLILDFSTAPVDADTLSQAVRRLVLTRADVALPDGQASAAGIVDFPRGVEAPASALKGTLTIGNFAAMTQRIMASRLVTPEQAMPFVVLAGALGQLSQGGTLSFNVASAPDGSIAINGRPTALRLPR